MNQYFYETNSQILFEILNKIYFFSFIVEFLGNFLNGLFMVLILTKPFKKLFDLG